MEGRIEPWHQRKRQRKLARRNTSLPPRTKRGTRKASPKFFCGQFFRSASADAIPAARKSTIAHVLMGSFANQGPVMLIRPPSGLFHGLHHVELFFRCGA